jgi:hypothetical protein
MSMRGLKEMISMALIGHIIDLIRLVAVWVISKTSEPRYKHRWWLCEGNTQITRVKSNSPLQQLIHD